MKKTMGLLLTILVLPTLSVADYTLSEQTVNPQSCTGIGHVESYVKDLCYVFGNGDQIMLNGSLEQSNLVVINSQKNNQEYYKPLGLANASYSVRQGSIQIIFRKNLVGANVRHAIVYRLDYKTDDGLEGFQIITVRLSSGLNRSKNTCTVMGYDSNSSSLFSGLPEAQQEAKMRERSLEFIRRGDFQTPRSRGCMDFEQEERPAPAGVEEEGDSEESDV